MLTRCDRQVRASHIAFHRHPFSIVACLALAGCVAGPDFERPDPAVPRDYVSGETPVRTQAADGLAGDAQYFLPGEDLPRGWWHWFGSPELVLLIERAFAGSPDLAASRARLRGAEAQLRAQRGLLVPQLGASGSASYGSGGGGGQGAGQGGGGQGGGGQGGGQAGGQGFGAEAFTVYTAGASVSYDLDLAGGNRRRVEAAAAEYRRQAQELQAAYLALIGNIVSAALESAALRAQIEAREQLIAGQNESIELARIRVEEGADARADLVTQLADVAALRATIPPLRSQLAASDNRLALLIGSPPAEAEIPRVELADLRLPEAVPISLPSRLVRTRPDILAAEALLARRSAEIGVEAADLYPNLTLDAGFGLFGGAGGLALAAPDAVFNLGAGLFAPLFDGGRREAEVDVAVAAYQEALALYRRQVLGAFVEVADGIRALENDAAALADQRTALEAARESLELARFRRAEGAISQIDVLTIQRRYEEARFAYIDAIASRFQDTAALFAALGSGPLGEAELAGIPAREYLDYTNAELEAGRIPEEGL